MKQLSLIPVCEVHGELKVYTHSRWRCVQCRREANKAWAKRDYDANPEKWLARGRTWRKSNPDKAKAAKRNWEEANRERIRDRHREYCREWYRRNPEGQLERTRRWLEQNPHAKAASNERLARRRERCRAELGPIDMAIVKAIYRKRAQLGRGFHVDHIQPLSRGGAHAPWNLQIIPAGENCAKNASPPTATEVARGKRRYHLLKLVFLAHASNLGTAA